MLTFTWNAPPHLPEARAQRTYVTVRLKPIGDNETLVTLHHGGWGDGGQWDQAYAYFDKAWGNVLANLQKRFAEGQAVRLDRMDGEPSRDDGEGKAGAREIARRMLGSRTGRSRRDRSKWARRV